MSKRDWLMGRTPQQQARKAQAKADLKALGDPDSPAKLRSRLQGLRVQRVGLYLIPGIGWMLLGRNRRKAQEVEAKLNASRSPEAPAPPATEP